MELLTGKNKEQFEDWVTDDENLSKWAFSYGENGLTFEEMDFYKLPFEMQIGVLLAYYDSLDTYVDIESDFFNDTNDFKFLFHINNTTEWVSSTNDGYPLYKSRNEAYKEAFKKANEIINNNK